jgi:hypothetical protein
MCQVLKQGPFVPMKDTIDRICEIEEGRLTG